MATNLVGTRYVTQLPTYPTVKLQKYVNRKAAQWFRFSLRAADAWQKYDNAVDLHKPLADVMALGEKADCFEECQLAAHKLWDNARGLLNENVN